MEMDVDVAGDVVEWQTLLSGMQVVTLEGASADGAWTLSGGCSWNIRSGPDASEGDLTLTRADGAELFATLAVGQVAELPSDAADAADYHVRLEFTVDGGTSEFDGAVGAVLADGRLSREGFALRVRVAVKDA